MKNIIKTLLIVMTLVIALVAFTGCDAINEAKCAINGHTMETFGEDLPTCTEEGLSSGIVCTVCGYAERNRFPIAATGHNMAAATCDLPSTCKNDGCDHTEGEALGHNMIDVAEVASTCTEVGYTAHKACDRKGCTHTEGKEEIAMIAHSYTVAVEALDPACGKKGYTAHNACECGAKDENYVEIPALEHDFPEEDMFYYPAPTCKEGGMLAGTCSLCGQSFYLKELPADPDAHTYVYGVCSGCGAQDADYVDYYLVGYINGADYGCEGDYANLGEYKFVDGKLTVTFTQDSYIFVKSGNLAGENVKWYLFESYNQTTEGTLIENKSEKMFIPGNVEITFTLTVNEDGTLTLSYAPTADVEEGGAED